MAIITPIQDGKAPDKIASEKEKECFLYIPRVECKPKRLLTEQKLTMRCR